MRKNLLQIFKPARSAVTIVEIMMMLLLLSIALTTLYAALIANTRFAQDTEYRIQAINIAREGIEGVINIRNTNWLKYSSDRKNCWDALAQCNPQASSQSGNQNKITNGSYLLLYGIGHGWGLLSQASWNDAQWGNSHATYLICIDEEGWYINCTNPSIKKCAAKKNAELPDTNCASPFAREIKIVRTSDTSDSMTITVTVHWSSSFKRSNVTLTTKLTNWKQHYN